MKAAALLLILVAGCNSDAYDCECPADFAMYRDLISHADLAPRACGNMTCPADHACVLCDPGGCDGGSCTSFACVALPTACEQDKTCGCLANNGGTTTECGLACGQALQCSGTPADPRWDFLCNGL